MKAITFVLTALASAVALGQSVPVPKAPSSLCIDDECPVTREAPRASWQYADGFEGSALQRALWKFSYAGKAAQSFPAGISREGGRAHRCDLTWNSGGDFRCELSALMKEYRGLNNPKFFQDTWWGFSIRPGEDPIQKGCIYAQWHGYAGFGPGDEADTVKLPVLSLSIDTSDPGRNTWRLHAQSAHSQPTLESDRRVLVSKHALAPVGDPNKWTDFVFRIRWDYRESGNGILQVWVNGQLKFDRQNISIGHNDNQLPYFKMGAYCSQYKKGIPTGVTRTVYHDAFRMAGPEGSYNAVRPGQG